MALLGERVQLDGHEQRVDDEERGVHLENVVHLERELVLEWVHVFQVRVAVDEPDVVGYCGIGGKGC